LPAYAEVESRCLSISNIVARVTVVILLLSILVIDSELYTTKVNPLPPSLIWAERGNSIAAADFRRGIIPSYCDDPAFDYLHVSRGWNYSNWTCVDPGHAEMYEVNMNEIFLLTSFSDRAYREMPCSIVHSNVSSCMTWRLDNPQSVNETGANCTCHWTRNYFTVGVESIVLGFLHGWEDPNLREYEIQSHILNYHDVEVRVLNGTEVIGTVAEWMAWAGASLNNVASHTSIGEPFDESSPPKPRTRVTGSVINVEIVYKVVPPIVHAYTHVRPSRDTWTAVANKVVHQKYQAVSTNDHGYMSNATSYQYNDRSRRGIKVRISGSYNIKAFSFSHFKTQVAVFIVFLGLVTSVLGTIAINGDRFGFGFQGLIFKKQLLKSWVGCEETKAMHRFAWVYSRLFEHINGGADWITRDHWKALAQRWNCDEYQEKKMWSEIVSELPDTTTCEQVHRIDVATLWMVLNNDRKNVLDEKWKLWSSKVIRRKSSVIRSISQSLLKRGKVIASLSPKKEEGEKLTSFRKTVARMSAIQAVKKQCFVERTLSHTERFE